MSRVRVGIHHYDRERFRLRELLALHSLWRGVESFPAASDAVSGTLLALSRDSLVGKLQELIAAALDRRAL